MMNPRKLNKTFPGFFVLFVWGFALMEIGLGKIQTTEIKIGVVLDLQTSFSKICLTSINMSLSDFYKAHANYTTRLAIHVRDSKEDVVQASVAALDLIKNEKVSAIIGPRRSVQADFVIRLANIAQVPTITFSATSPLLTSPYFVRATLNDISQAKAIATIVKSYQWRRVVAIYVNDEFGEGIIPYLSDALHQVQASIAYRSVISLEANNDQISNELYKLMTMQTRVFVVHMPPCLGFRVIRLAREMEMMEEGYAWLLTDGMTNWIRSKECGSSLENTQGLLGVRSFVPKSKKLEDFKLKWKRKSADINVFALWAYDSITALAMAVEEVSKNSLGFGNASVSLGNLGTLGVSTYGPSLLKSLSKVHFEGLAGEFKLINMQLESSTFEIVNFVRNQEIVIGQINKKSDKTTSFSMRHDVLWLGNTKVVPKGWEIPTRGKKFKVGVPMKEGFFEFVELKKNPSNNVEFPTGFSIDVFEAALKKLPYSLIPQYVHFESPENYDDLVSQVYNGTWDAVAGDVTIRANRSSYVDFTLPYTDSGVSMLVPMKDNESKNTWVFLEPWSLDLWVTTACFFIFIGFIVWTLEHRVNNDFRGPPHHQIGTSFWFSFSTMNFAHREKVVSNLGRFVVIVWCFVMLVLTQSYTANLTSLLTVQRYRAEITTLNDLIKNGNYVGYQRGSFVYELLKGQRFHESQLKPFDSAEDCHKLFTNGTIVAAFDEVSYLKVIISQYCSKYAMVEPSFKTAGFGFVFPKNSPLTGDVSKAILDVTQSDEMQNIERKWFKNQSDCPDPNTTLSHNRLSLSSFWGLFLIAGLVSSLALLFFVVNFLYEHKHTLLHEDSANSLWRKLTLLIRIFDAKDTTSHTFKETVVHNVSSPTSTTSQCTPYWLRSPSRNLEFEVRRVSVVSKDESSNPQLDEAEDEGGDAESRAN